MRKLLASILLWPIALVALGFYMEPFFPLGDWRWLIVSVLAAAPATWIYRKEMRAAFYRKKKKYWEIGGAPKKRFKLYEAACLLREIDPVWPLTSQKTNDEYSSLVKAAHECRIRIIPPAVGFRSGSLDWKENQQIALRGEEVTKSVEVKLLDGRTQYTQRLQALRDIEVDRKALREYLESESRPVPEFLHERFDKADSERKA